MKLITTIIITACLIVSAVMIHLVRAGGALKPTGVIKPAEIGSEPGHIGKQIAVRLFPDFDADRNIVWRIEAGAEELMEVPRAVLENYRLPVKPQVIDLRTGEAAECTSNCWYIVNFDQPLPEAVARRVGAEAMAEVFVQYFDRNEKVPETCENEKILEPKCVKPICVREVRRKIKTAKPHFFMQRYLKSQFYLFIEKPNAV